MNEAWQTAPISPTCEVLLPRTDIGQLLCDEPTTLCYPSMGGGWMALCECHGQKYLTRTTRVEILIRRGETFQGTSKEELARL